MNNEDETLFSLLKTFLCSSEPAEREYARYVLKLRLHLDFLTFVLLVCVFFYGFLFWHIFKW